MFLSTDWQIYCDDFTLSVREREGLTEKKLYSSKYSRHFAVIVQLIINPMDEKEMMELSRTSMFFVTSFSAFLFTIIIKVLDGSHSRLLVLIGVIAFFLGLLNWAGKMVMDQSGKKEK